MKPCSRFDKAHTLFIMSGSWIILHMIYAFFSLYIPIWTNGKRNFSMSFFPSFDQIGVFTNSDSEVSAFFVISSKSCTHSRCTFFCSTSLGLFRKSKLTFISQYGRYHDRNIPYERKGSTKKPNPEHFSVRAVKKHYIIYSIWQFLGEAKKTTTTARSIKTALPHK